MGRLSGFLKRSVDEMAQFVNVELRSVDDNVGEFADGRHHRAVPGAGFRERNIFAERVRAPRLAVAPQE